METSSQHESPSQCREPQEGTVPSVPTGPVEYFASNPLMAGEVDENRRSALGDLIKDFPDAMKSHAFWVLVAQLEAAHIAYERCSAIARAELLAGGDSLRDRRQELREKLSTVSIHLDNLRARFQSLVEQLSACALPVSPAQATVAGVEQALVASLPSTEAIAGACEVTPVRAASSGKRIWWALADVLGILVVGGLISVAIGTVTGLLTLNDLNALTLRDPGTGRLMVRYLLIGLTGPAVAWFMSGAIDRTVRSLTRRLEPRTQPTFPRHRNGWIIGVLISLLAALWASEITVEAIALRHLHQQVVERTHMRNPHSKESTYPCPIYVLIGCLIGSTLFAAKASTSHGLEEDALRRARVEALRQQIEGDLRARPETRRALMLAQLIEQARGEIARAEAQSRKAEEELAALPARPVLSDNTQRALDAAYAALIGATDKLHEVEAAAVANAHRLSAGDPEDAPEPRQVVRRVEDFEQPTMVVGT